MHVPIWCELVCRVCSTHIAGRWGFVRLPKRDLVKSAKEGGAQFKHNEVFCSQKCLQKFEAEQET